MFNINTSQNFFRSGINLEKIKKFIENKADFNAKDEYGSTPLCVLCRNGNIDIIKVIKSLVFSGIEIDLKTFPQKIISEQKSEQIKVFIETFKNGKYIFNPTGFQCLPRALQEEFETLLLCEKIKSKSSLFFRVPKPINFIIFTEILYQYVDDRTPKMGLSNEK